MDEFEFYLSRVTEKDKSPAFQVLQRMIKEKDGNYDKELLKKFIKFMQMNTLEESIETSHKHNNEVAAMR